MRQYTSDTPRLQRLLPGSGPETSIVRAVSRDRGYLPGVGGLETFVFGGSLTLCVRELKSRGKSFNGSIGNRKRKGHGRGKGTVGGGVEGLGERPGRAGEERWWEAQSRQTHPWP